MAIYDEVASFGGVYFNISDITKTFQDHTLKTQSGKTLVQKTIPLVNAMPDAVLEITGLITGLSRTSAQTLSQAIEIDRAALDALNDGDKHAYSDGKHSFDAVIATNSLRWDDNANRLSDQPNQFTVRIIEW